MDNEREVYDAFSRLYDRSKVDAHGHRHVSMVDLLNTNDLPQEKVLEVIEKWIASNFLAVETGGTEVSLTSGLWVTSDGEIFFKTKYRV